MQQVSGGDFTPETLAGAGLPANFDINNMAAMFGLPSSDAEAEAAAGDNTAPASESAGYYCC